MKLTLQKQPTPVTCVQTCLAMALGVPVQAVIDIYGSQPMNGMLLSKALNDCHFEWNQLVHAAPLIASGYYFLTVPSLNKRGAHHQIILHYEADFGCSGLTVFDPSTANTYKEDGSDLISWSEPVLFRLGGYINLPKAYLEEQTTP